MQLRKTKNDNNAMIFNASYLNDHNEIWNVGHTAGKVQLRSFQRCNKKLHFLTYVTALSTGMGFYITSLKCSVVELEFVSPVNFLDVLP